MVELWLLGITGFCWVRHTPRELLCNSGSSECWGERFRLNQTSAGDQWAIDVNRNWRIVFRFEDGDAHVVNYEDYHWWRFNHTIHRIRVSSLNRCTWYLLISAHEKLLKSWRCHPLRIIVYLMHKVMFHLKWLSPFGFNNTYAFAMRHEDARKNRWTSHTFYLS